MGRKGKNKAKKSSLRTPQPPKPQPRESSPSHNDHCDGEDLSFYVPCGLMFMEERIAKLKAAVRDHPDGSNKLAEIFPLYEAELKAFKAKMRDDDSRKNGNDKHRADDSSVVRNFDRSICSVEENKYYDDLREFVDTWKILACEGRKEGSKSLIEVLHRHRSDGSERARVFEMLIGVGIKISSLMAEYFSLFVGTLDDSEIVLRFRTIKNTLLLESLDKVDCSPVIDRFVKFIDSAIWKTRVSNDNDDDDDDDDGDDRVLFGERERNLLDKIFFKVLYLEVVFCCPSFPENLEKKDLMSCRDYLVKMFGEKLGKLRSELNEFKKSCEVSDGELSSKRNELKKVLVSEAKLIWKGLDLHQKN